MHRIYPVCAFQTVAIIFGIIVSAAAQVTNRSAIEAGEKLLLRWDGKPVPLLLAEAERGDAAAQYYLAWHHMRGTGRLQVDFQKSVHWFRRAAMSGVPEAQLKMGQFACRGIGVIASYEEAEGWYRRAAEAGLAAAQFELFKLCQTPLANASPGQKPFPDRIQKSRSDANGWLRLSNEQGYGPSYFWMAMADLRGEKRVGQIRELERTRLILEGARQGDFNAQWARFYSCLTGEYGVAPDPAEAWMWRELWMQAGLTNAEITARLIWLPKGWDTTDVVKEGRGRMSSFRNSDVAERWRHVSELIHLWNPGLPPVSMPESLARYVTLSTKAAEGDVDSQFLLALCLQHNVYAGMGNEGLMIEVTDDGVQLILWNGQPYFERCREAVEWYRKAAAKGHQGARANLAYMLWNGFGSDQRRAEAVPVLQELSRKGDIEATYAIGLAYESGVVGAQSQAEALRYFRIAAEAGHPAAIRKLAKQGLDAGTLAAARARQQPAAGQEPGESQNQNTRTARLAIVTLESRWQNASELLTAELSGNPGLAMLERDQINKVLSEQSLSAGGNADLVRVGRLLDADGLLLLESRKVRGVLHLQTRLIAVRPGAVLGFDNHPVTSENLTEWPKLVARHYALLFQKLTRPPTGIVALSLLNIRSDTDRPGSAELDRELTFLLANRLAREYEVMLLERQRMDSLKAEAGLTGIDDQSFWKGGYLVEGSISAGSDGTNSVGVLLKLTPPGAGSPIQIQIQGSRDNLIALAGELGSAVMSRLKGKTDVGSWTAREEAIAYWEEALWARKWSMNRECLEALEASHTLGYNTIESRKLLLEVNQSLAEIPQVAGQLDAETASFQVKSMEIYLAMYPDPDSKTPAQIWYEPGPKTSAEECASNHWWCVEFPEQLLTSSGKLLEHAFRLPDKVRNSEPRLVELRSLARQLVERTQKLPEVLKHESSRSLVAIVTAYGPVFQDTPEAAGEFVMQMVRSGWYVHAWSFHYPHPYTMQFPVLPSWKTGSVEVMRARWKSFLGRNWADASLKDRVSLAVLALDEAEANDDRLEWALKARDQLLAMEPEILDGRLSLQHWQVLYELLKDQGGFWGKTLREDSIDSSKAASTNALLELQKSLPAMLRVKNSALLAVMQQRRHDAQMAFFQKNLSMGIARDQRFDPNAFDWPSDFSFTAEDATLLLPMLASYHTKLPVGWLRLDWLESRLKPLQIVAPAVAKPDGTVSTASVQSVVGAVSPVAVSSTPSLIASMHAFPNRGVGPVLTYERELLIPTVVRSQEGQSTPTSKMFITRFSVPELRMNTIEIPVGLAEVEVLGGVQDKNVPPLFAVHQGMICIPYDGGVHLYSLASKRWAKLPLPIEAGAHLYSINGALYASGPASILKVDLETRNITVLASSRRKPKVTSLDRMDSLGSPWLLAGPGGTLRAIIGQNVMTYDVAANDWATSGLIVKELEGHLRQFQQPVEKRWFQNGILVLTATDLPIPVAVHALWEKETDAVLCLFPEVTSRMLKSRDRGRWNPVREQGILANLPSQQGMGPMSFVLGLEGDSLWMASHLPSLTTTDQGRSFVPDGKEMAPVTLRYFESGNPSPKTATLRIPKFANQQPLEIDPKQAQTWNIVPAGDHMLLINHGVGIVWAYSKADFQNVAKVEPAR